MPFRDTELFGIKYNLDYTCDKLAERAKKDALTPMDYPDALDLPADLKSLPEIDIRLSPRKYPFLWKLFVDPFLLKFTGVGTNISSVINILSTLLLAVFLMISYIYTYRNIADANEDKIRIMVILWSITGGLYVNCNILYFGVKFIRNYILFREKDYFIKGDGIELYIRPRRDAYVNIYVDDMKSRYLYILNIAKRKRRLINGYD